MDCGAKLCYLLGDLNGVAPVVSGFDGDGSPQQVLIPAIEGLAKLLLNFGPDSLCVQLQDNGIGNHDLTPYT